MPDAIKNSGLIVGNVGIERERGEILFTRNVYDVDVKAWC